ncbi:polyhydroxyalkanoic acid system family protein [Novosphingobium sp. G106]|uniref:polyhydroxyalkanoic acid system family protein n=1 Tax=Novosphingobium sp. G106 TaxID=2849500 RepID=UPI001C2D186F|nr:polyhydroxyalkanoic acid system family protein [Novosphingobium sp. G106]MBV1687802.1 polyhydroxyalkanoic acid system family protein [Novosphingobium sp. G106]
MPDPITFDIPHKVGKAAAREKLGNGVGQIAGIIPGGSLKEHYWDGDTLFFVIEAVGQRVGTKIEVIDTRVHAEIELPPTIALFAGTIIDKLKLMGTKLLT